MPQSNLDAFVRAVCAEAPATKLLTDPQETEPFGSDWTRLPGRPGPVVLPASVQEVATVLRLCRDLRLAVTPSGGRTGLAGGAVALNGEVILNLGRMASASPVDILSRTVRVQAGMTNQALYDHCVPSGLFWPIDLASKGTCQIGGNLATNAGGVRVIGYGMARKWVLGLQAVTIDGEILELNGELEKNNAGYDLLQLLVGSEGTLAVITEATLKLEPLPRAVEVALLACPSLESSLALFERTRGAPFDVLAFEFFSEKCLAVVEKQLARRARFSSKAPFYVLVEIVPHGASRAATESWLASLLESGDAVDGMLADSSADRREVWGLREGITESIQKTGLVRKYDVSVPVRGLERFLGDAEKLISDSKLEIDLYLFGHLGDGSPHLNLLKPANATVGAYEKDCARFEKALYPLLKLHRGSVSAEHGIGCLKTNWVQYSRSEAELRLFHRIKEAFDPYGLLNPGKLLPTSA